jgi:hypothetical protein
MFADYLSNQVIRKDSVGDELGRIIRQIKQH